MIRQKSNPALERLLDPNRPPLFSSLRSMLRGDGVLAGALKHEFRYLREIPTQPRMVSARQWRIAIRTSRILRGQRERATRAE